MAAGVDFQHLVPAVATRQFQSRHGQRQLAAWYLSACALPFAAFLGAHFIDRKPAGLLIALIVVVEVVVVSWLTIGHRGYGLFIGPDKVQEAGPGGESLGKVDAAHPIAFSMFADTKFERVRVEDAYWNRANVAWLAHVPRRTFWGKIGYRVDNDILVRMPRSANRQERRWKPTGLVWRDDNGTEVLEYFRREVDLTIGPGAGRGVARDQAASPPNSAGSPAR